MTAWRMYLVLIVMFLVSVKIFSIDYPKNAPDKWKKLTNQETYDYFVKINQDYDKLRSEYDKIKAVSDNQNTNIDTLQAELTRIKPKRDRYGISGGLMISADNFIELEFNQKVGYIYLWNNSFLVNPEIFITEKIKSFFPAVSGYGGGISLSIGWVF